MFKTKKLNIKKVNLQNGAVVIADVHYKRGNELFLSLLKKWAQKPPCQIFLLGDIFHLLLPFKYLVEYNKEAIFLINELSEKTEVYYTPGNHDFNIENIFVNVTFADIFTDEKKKILLTHGDLITKDIMYQIYTYIIRNNLFEDILNVISFNFINNWLLKKTIKKQICCKKIKNFDKIIKKKLQSIDINYDIIIEGHYHQNRTLYIDNKTYINIPAFVCTKNYIIIHLKNNPMIKEIKYDGR